MVLSDTNLPVSEVLMSRFTPFRSYSRYKTYVNAMRLHASRLFSNNTAQYSGSSFDGKKRKKKSKPKFYTQNA